MSATPFDAYFSPQTLEDIKREEGVDAYHARVNGAHIRSVYQNIPSSLDLFFHKFGNYFTILLADALCENTSVESLGLEMNQIGNKGAKTLAWALSLNRSILRVDLSNNNIGTEGILSLARGPMRQSSSIVSWNLTNNMNRDVHDPFEEVDKAYHEVLAMLRQSKSVLEYHGPYEKFLESTLAANRLRAELLTDTILHIPEAISADQLDDLQECYGAVMYILRESGFQRVAIQKLFSRLEAKAAQYRRTIFQPTVPQIRATAHFMPGKQSMTMLTSGSSDEASAHISEKEAQEKACP